MTADRSLRLATAFYAVGWSLHTADHLRRGIDAVTPEVLWAGNVLGLLSVLTIVAVLRRHRLAPALAAAVGVQAALGVTASHLLPTWSAFSDSLPDQHLQGWTWAAVLLEIAGAAAMGAAGLRAVRSSRGGRRALTA